MTPADIKERILVACQIAKGRGYRIEPGETFGPCGVCCPMGAVRVALTADGEAQMEFGMPDLINCKLGFGRGFFAQFAEAFDGRPGHTAAGDIGSEFREMYDRGEL